MKKSTLLTYAGILGGAVAAAAQPSAAGKFQKKQVKNASKPNVVVILADDIGYGDFSCNGAVGIPTPNIDQLAATGVNFRHAHAAASTSTPSRYSLFTGEYNWRRNGTGVSDGDAAMIIKPTRYTMPKMFKEAGYATAAIGKWHLGLGSTAGQQKWNDVIDQGPREIGFDYSYIMAATADRVPCVFIEDQRVVGLTSSDPIQVSYTSNFAGEPTGKANPEMLRLKFDFGHDASIINGVSRIGFMKGGKSALWVDENISDSIVAHANRFIEKNKNTPFFLYMGTNDAHVPRLPHPRFAGKSKLGARGDAIVEFDDAVGQVVKKLDELGLRENTLIIVTSDNGAILRDGYFDQSTELVESYSETDPVTGEAKKHRPSGPYSGTKYSIYQGGTAVPCILNWKGSVAPKQSEALVSQVDLLNTFAALVGVNTEGKAPADSQNQLDAWLGKDGAGREYIVEHSGSCLAVFDKEWKYVEPNSSPQTVAWANNVPTGYRNYDQLFAIATDITEQNNVASANSETVTKLKAILAKEKALGVNMSLSGVNPEKFVMSTSEQPVWFMIHDNRPEMSFFKVAGDKVQYTRDLAEVGRGADELFFRMEPLPDNPANFVIKSKTKGENFFVGRSDADETLTANALQANSNSSWTFASAAVADYRQIKSLGQPSVLNGKERICLNTRIEQNKIFLWIDAPADVGNQFAAYQVNRGATGIKSSYSDNEQIRVVNNRIIVNVPFALYTLSGQQLNASAQLPKGVYIAQTRQQRVKVAVR